MTFSRLSRPKNRDFTNPISATGAPSRRSLAFSNSSWSRRLKVGMTFSFTFSVSIRRYWQLRERLPFPGGLRNLPGPLKQTLLQISLYRRWDDDFRRAFAGALRL